MSMWISGVLLMGGIAMAACSAGLSAPEPAESKDRPHVTFKIISEHASLTPGKTETLGLVFTVEPHWHIYFKGAPGGGNPPSIEDSGLPTGFELGEIEWPAPKRYVAPGDIYDSVYENQVTLLLPVKVPPNAKEGDKAKISLKMAWLECSDVCVFGKGESAIELPISGAESHAAPSKAAAEITRARASLPKALPADGSIKAVLKDGTFTVQAPGAERLEFYPGPRCGDIDKLAEATLSKSDSLKIQFEGANKTQSEADGVLGVWPKGGGGPSYYRISLLPH